MRKLVFHWEESERILRENPHKKEPIKECSKQGIGFNKWFKKTKNLEIETQRGTNNLTKDQILIEEPSHFLKIRLFLPETPKK